MSHKYALFFSFPPLRQNMLDTKDAARVGGFFPKKTLRLQILFVILQL